MRLAYTWILAALPIAALPTPAVGQGDTSDLEPEAEELEQARASFEMGVDLVAAEDFPSALAAFEESYELAPRPTTLFNIGMCQKGMFLYVEATATFRRYLEDTTGEGETEMRTKARLAIEELSTLVGRLAVTGAPDGALITVDGKRAGVTPASEPIEVDPGKHAVRITADGYEPFETEVTVASSTEAAIRVEMAELPAAEEEPVDEYAALLAKAEQAKKDKLARAARLEEEWVKVEKIALEPSLGKEERALVLEHFLDEYPSDNPHKQTARLWKQALEEGDEPADVLMPDYLRTKTEWVALRIGGGNYGGAAMLSAITLRRELFCWDILRVSGGGGVLEKDESDTGAEGTTDKDRRWIASGGTAVGIPWHFEDTGRFEIRFGVGVMVGLINSVDEEQVLGLIFVPEGVLVWHAFEYFALQAGIDVQLGAIDFEEGFSFPTPALGAFLGVRI